MKNENLKKDFDNAVKGHDITKMKSLCYGLSFYSISSLIGKKGNLKSVVKNKDLNFIKKFISWVNEVNEIENHKTNGYVDELWLYGKQNPYKLPQNFIKNAQLHESYKKTKLKIIQDIKNQMFVNVVDAIVSDDVKVLDVIKNFWPDRKNINYLAKKCGYLELENISDILMHDINKEKSHKQFPLINRHYFLKNIIETSSISFLENLNKKYKKEIKNTFSYLKDHDTFWLYTTPKDIKIEDEGYYSQDEESFKVNFNFEKLLWLDKNSIGLKQQNYKALDLFIPKMKVDEIKQYIYLDKERVQKKVQECLEKKSKSWEHRVYDDESLEHIPQNERVTRIIKLLAVEDLQEKLEKKENKSIKVKI